MNTQNTRVANFSSSSMHKLVSMGRATKTKTELENVGAPYSTYIEEKVIETLSGRQINNEHSAKPTTWGTYVEKFAFQNIGIEYVLESKKRYKHKIIKRWTGSPDIYIENDSIVGDIKCPYTLAEFGKMVNELSMPNTMIGRAMLLKKIKKEYYWQLVSNAVLTRSKHAEIVLFMPYRGQLKEIKESLNNYDGTDLYKYYWIVNSFDEELPHLPEESLYKNSYTFRMRIPEEDKKLLRDRVRMANDEIEMRLEVLINKLAA